MVGMSQPTTLIMNPDNTFTDEDGYLPIPEWARLNGVSPRTVARWIANNELPGAEQRGTKQKWYIPVTAMRIASEEQDEPHRGTEIEPAIPAGEVAVITDPEFNDDDEFQDHLWNQDLATYLARMPAYIPVRIGALLLGLGISYVKANPDRYRIVHRGGPNQTDVMPKLVILKEAGLL